jgi:hypothetical protein
MSWFLNVPKTALAKSIVMFIIGGHDNESFGLQVLAHAFGNGMGGETDYNVYSSGSQYIPSYVFRCEKSKTKTHTRRLCDPVLFLGQLVVVLSLQTTQGRWQRRVKGTDAGKK